MSNLLLSFANLNIDIEFQKESYDRALKNHIVEQIKSNYRTLLGNKTKDTRIDYKIIFQDSDQIKQIKLKEKHFYAEFYTKSDSKIYETYYYISPLQFQVLLHLILHDYAKKSSISLLHSSANLVYGKSAVFMGKPGNGKTTIMNMLSEKYSPLADDSFIVDKSKNTYISYQTPFVEKIAYITKKKSKIPLGGIYLLKKSKNYSIEKIINKHEIIKKLLENCLIDDRQNISLYMKNIQDLAYHFDNFYLIEFGLNKKKLVSLFENK